MGITRKVFLLHLFLLISCSLSAQYQSIGFGIGAATFEGETSTYEDFAVEEIGRSAYFYYNRWLKDSRWQYSFLATYHQIRGRIQVENFLVSNTLYQSRTRHFNLGAGMRYYLDPKLSHYQPSRGQWAIFGAAYLGLESFYSNTEANRMGAGAAEYMNEDFKLSPYISGELGLRIFINSEWYSEISGGMKYGHNDHWDGIAGPTNIKDYIGFVQLGLGYAF